MRRLIIEAIKRSLDELADPLVPEIRKSVQDFGDISPIRVGKIWVGDIGYLRRRLPFGFNYIFHFMKSKSLCSYYPYYLREHRKNPKKVISYISSEIVADFLFI